MWAGSTQGYETHNDLQVEVSPLYSGSQPSEYMREWHTQKTCI